MKRVRVQAKLGVKRKLSDTLSNIKLIYQNNLRL